MKIELPIEIICPILICNCNYCDRIMPAVHIDRRGEVLTVFRPATFQFVPTNISFNRKLKQAKFFDPAYEIVKNLCLPTI